MSEANEPPRPPSSERRPISPEALEKLSKGDIRLTPDMVITGEGDDRKLHIIVKPDDPAYIQYLTEHQSSINLAQQIHLLGDKGGDMNKILGAMSLDKRFLEGVVTHRSLMGYANNNVRDFLRRFEEIPQDKSIESIKLRQQLESEVIEFGDLFDYTQHLVEQKAVEVILPEQKAN